MSIDSQLFINKFPVIVGALVLLIGGKTLLVMGLGRIFGLSTVVAARAGLLLAPGGEFAFVAFGEAVNQASFNFVSIRMMVQSRNWAWFNLNTIFFIFIP